MAYAPTNWVEKATKVGPTNLNKLELGLQAAAAVADAALPTPAGTNGQFLKKVGGVWVPTSFAISDIPDPGAGKVVGSSGGAAAVFPPGFEVVSAHISSAPTTASTTYVALQAFSAATFENVKYYCELSIPVLRHSAGGQASIFFALNDGVSDVAVIAVDITASVGPAFFSRLSFTPAAGAHTYTLNWKVGVAGTATLQGANGAAELRIVKA